MKSRKNWRPLLRRFFAGIRSTASSKYVKLSNFAGEVGDSCIISNGRGNNSTDVHVNYYRVQYVHLQLPHTVLTPKMGDVFRGRGTRPRFAPTYSRTRSLPDIPHAA